MHHEEFACNEALKVQSSLEGNDEGGSAFTYCFLEQFRLDLDFQYTNTSFSTLF